MQRLLGDAPGIPREFLVLPVLSKGYEAPLMGIYALLKAD
jgi:hypothetical protein